jgi:hypothetical protein
MMYRTFFMMHAVYLLEGGFQVCKVQQYDNLSSKRVRLRLSKLMVMRT